MQIVAIGRNYADHAKELGNAIPKGKWTGPAPRSHTPGLVLTLVEPFFFLKPTSSYISPGEGPVELPKGTIVHHEGGSALTRKGRVGWARTDGSQSNWAS